KESFGAALQYFTGSKEHNVALRELALKKGLTINEYGLYHNDDKKKSVAGKTEEEIYKKLGLEFVPPELRENRGEIEAAQTEKLPKLIEEKDIRGDFHNHTKLSDGAHSLEEMAQKAKEKGWEWFVSADHSQSLKVARGLDPETLWKKKKEIEILNQKWNNFKVLLGSEVDILSDGTMDYADDILKEIDFVVASVHTGFKQGEEKLTERILKAMENPYVDIVGHLTGRLLGSREPYPIQLQRILDAAAKTQTAMEINGQPQRLDLYDSYAQSAKGLGVPIVLTTDAHSTSQLDYMTYAVATARRAWLRKEDILNCLSLKEILDWKSSVCI
ncbi:MAG: DNA polymerase III, partial [Elusimicrobia bacterium]|nr:DNA polymerase III [Elusimicrobiota bacterium]